MNKKKLLKLCADRGITIAELEKDLGMSNGSLRKDGDIKSQRLAAIAEYFNVSMEYLMYGDSELPSYLHGFDIDGTEIELVQCYRNADENTKNMIVQLLAYAKKMNDKN